MVTCQNYLGKAKTIPSPFTPTFHQTRNVNPNFTPVSSANNAQDQQFTPNQGLNPNIHFNPNFAQAFQNQKSNQKIFNKTLLTPRIFYHVTMFQIFKNNSNPINCYTPSTSQNFSIGNSSMLAISIPNLHNCGPVIQFSAVIMNIDDKLANDIRSMSSNTTVTFNTN